MRRTARPPASAPSSCARASPSTGRVRRLCNRGSSEGLQAAGRREGVRMTAPPRAWLPGDTVAGSESSCMV